MTKILMLALLAAPLVACDGQVDSDHQGTALAKLTGTVRDSRAQSRRGVEVVAAWDNTSVDPDTRSVDAVQVSGSFPTQFTLSIYTPPPPESFNEDESGTKVAVAIILAHEEGASLEDGSTYLGAETNHLLVYVPADVPAGSDVSYLLHSTPKAGFHIYGIRRLSELESGQREDCIQAHSDENGERPPLSVITEECGGLPTFDEFVPLENSLRTPLEIELVDDPDDIDLPNWT